MPAPPFIAPTTEPRTYTGVCHCKANKFTVELPALTGGAKCNCSFCSVHDVIWLFTDKSKVKFEREGPTIDYEWLEKKYQFNFCATCGNLLKGSSTGGLALNVRLFQDVDIWALKGDPKYDGASLNPPYKPADFAGPPFTDEAKDASKTKLYFGNCHCGACTIAVRSKPLSEVMINECNCSFCIKAARVHFYPTAEDVHIGGVENLKVYKTEPNSGAFFCKTCGVALLVASLDGAKDADHKAVANAKEVLGHNLNVHAVNVRVLRGVECDALKINKYDGRSKDPQFTAD